MKALVHGPLVAAVALTAGALAAQTFEGSTTVVAVEVPVRVLHRGQPVRGLTADDFRILDGGVERAIVGFEVIDVSAPDAAAPSPGAAGSPLGRNYLFLFDLAYAGAGPHDSRRRLEGGLAAVRSLVAGELQPADRVAVAYLSPLRGLKLVLDFTADRRQARIALAALGLVVAAQPDRLERDLAGWSRLAPPRRGWRSRTPRGPIDATLADLVAEARTSSARGATDLPHASLLMQASRGLGRLSRRAELAGPRYLVLLSQGPLYGDEATRSLSYMGEIADAFRRESWSIESIDLGGLGFGRDSLLLLAAETGGRLYTNSRDLDLLLERMAETTSVSYLLTFQADGVAVDGAYHRLKIRLTGGPRGAKVIHRPGYYAPAAAELVAPR